MTKYKPEIRLTAEDKRELWLKINRHMENHPPRVLSPYAVRFWPVFKVSLTLGLLAAITTTSAAELALPGDWLYPVKVELNEKVISSLASSAPARASVRIALVERRLREAEKIAAAPKPSSQEKRATLAQATQMIKAEVKNAQSLVKDMEKEDIATALEAGLKLEAVISSHQDALSTLDQSSENEDLNLEKVVSLVEDSASSTSALNKEARESLLSQSPQSAIANTAMKQLAEAEKELSRAKSLVVKKGGSEKIRARIETSEKLFLRATLSAEDEDFGHSLTLIQQSRKLSAGIDTLLSISTPDIPEIPKFRG